MSAYVAYDLSETLNAAGMKPSEFERVLAAWGVHGEYAEWEGGFLLLTRQGRYTYLTGWCDTSGWGCQDDFELTNYDYLPALAELHDPLSDWDEDPADLQRFIETGVYDPLSDWDEVYE